MAKGSPPPSTTVDSHNLYLVSAEKRGIKYWKVGITHHQDPLKRDSKHYREVFKSEITTDSSLIELAVARTFKWLMEMSMRDGYQIQSPPAREGLSYDFPLEVPNEIYEWWLDLSKTSDRAPNPWWEPDCPELFGDEFIDKPNFLLDDNHPDGIPTQFQFCRQLIKTSPALFDFSGLAQTYQSADLATLTDAFGYYGVWDKTLEEGREHAHRWFSLAKEHVPKVQRLLRFRPVIPELPEQLEPMW